MDLIENLRFKYRDNDPVLRKLETVLETLPALLQATDDEYAKKQVRRNDALQKRTAFVQYFLQMYTFYYIPQTNTYVQYVDDDYVVVSEDDVTHLILKNVNVDKPLAAWKYKIRIHIFKRIKETCILDACPEAFTVKQVVRSLWPSIFTTKSCAKYFLTIVGDLLHGKRGLVYFCDPSFKSFIHVLGHDLAMLVGKTIFDDFKYKYVAHDFLKCRVLPGRGDVVLKGNTPNLLAVAAFYSRKYGSVDGYLGTCMDSELPRTAFALRDNTPASLIDAFLGDFFVKDAAVVSYKDVLYLWRTFLRRNSLPAVVPQQNFKHHLTELGILDAFETCKGLRALYAPNRLNWDLFCERYVTPDPAGDVDPDELVALYNGWCESRSLHVTADADWISRGKVRGSLWDKAADITAAMDVYRHEATYSPHLDDMYAFYKSYAKRYGKMVASRSYFDMQFR